MTGVDPPVEVILLRVPETLVTVPPLPVKVRVPPRLTDVLPVRPPERVTVIALEVIIPGVEEENSVALNEAAPLVDPSARALIIDTTTFPVSGVPETPLT
jgi:hypothetical protein